MLGDATLEREDVLCSFEAGNEIDKNIGSRRVTMSATSDIYSISSYDAYIMDTAEYDHIVYDLGQDPFVQYGIRPETLGSGNKMRSKTVPGPVNLAIFTQTPQPFTSEDNFVVLLLTLGVREDGELKEVRELNLKVPEEIEASEDTNFCDFEFSGEYDGDYKIYKASDEVLNRINNVEDYGLEISLQCPFSMPELSGGDLFVQTSIIAEADYVFQIDKTTTVEIRKLGV